MAWIRKRYGSIRPSVAQCIGRRVRDLHSRRVRSGGIVLPWSWRSPLAPGKIKRPDSLSYFLWIKNLDSITESACSVIRHLTFGCFFFKSLGFKENERSRLSHFIASRYSMRCIRCDSMGCTLWYSLSTTQTTSDAFDSFLHSAPSENTHKRLRSKISSAISFWSSAWLLNRERLFAVVSYWFFDTMKLPILVHLARPSNQTTECSLRRTLRQKSIEESSPWLLLKVSKIDTLKWFHWNDFSFLTPQRLPAANRLY